MYYNKELFANEEIKSAYNRLNKLQIILLLSFIFVFTAVALLVILLLGAKYDDFMLGYAMAIFGTVVMIAEISILLPFQVKIEKLRCRQT